MDSDHFLIAAERAEPVEQPREGLDRLTEREREVVLRAARGGANKEIAYELGLAHSTIRVFMARAASKLGAANRSELLQRVTALIAAQP